MSPESENIMMLTLDKNVLLKGGELQDPVPGEYLEMDEPAPPATDTSHAAKYPNIISLTILMPEC